MKRALFLDRDGVINVDKKYIYKIEDFEFLPGIFEVLKYFQAKGYLLIVITNQAGIGRGYYSEDDFHQLTAWMLRQFENQGIGIAKVYYAPSHPDFGIGIYKRDDQLRKPNPGMILMAKEEFDIDLRHSILIGDKDSDIEAGLNAGVGLKVLLTSVDQKTRPVTNADLVVFELVQLIEKDTGCLG